VREALEVDESTLIWGIQVNVRLHRTEDAKEAAEGANMRMLPGYPSYSPDLNVIENMFGVVLRRMGVMDLTNPVKGRGEARKQNALQRFRDLLQGEVAKGALTTLARSMPRRLAAVIKAKGGPTKY
jgi:hypothetical protein